MIRAKLFLEGYRDRHSTDALIKAAKAVEPSRFRSQGDPEDEMRQCGRVLAFACTVLVACHGLPRANRPDAPQVGQTASGLSPCRAIDDRAPVSLSDFRGKKVLLIQFASW